MLACTVIAAVVTGNAKSSGRSRASWSQGFCSVVPCTLDNYKILKRHTQAIDQCDGIFACNEFIKGELSFRYGKRNFTNESSYGLAWQAVKPSARSPFQARELPTDSPRKLFAMGFLTNVLNPKVAIFYLSIFLQFIVPEHGSLFIQSMTLGITQISVSFVVNLAITLSAARIAVWFGRNSLWLTVQRYVMGCVLGALAIRLAVEQRRNV
jgi:hypothetical protein